MAFPFTPIRFYCLRAVAGLMVCSLAAPLAAHEGHSHTNHDRSPDPNRSTRDHVFAAISVDGDKNSFQTETTTFRWQHRPDLGTQPDAMVEAARTGLHNNADENPLTGEVVTVVSGYGLVSLDRDLGAWSLVEDQDSHFAAGMNAHGTDCFEIDGRVLYAFASTNTGEVIIAEGGKILAKLTTPDGNEFDHPTANAYYAGGGKFVPCDVVWASEAEKLVVVTGYSAGDFAVTAVPIDGDDRRGDVWKWSGTAFGGKEKIGGPFSTAHGIEVGQVDGTEVLHVASRSHGRLFGFTASGAMVGLPGTDATGHYFVQLDPAARPCNIALANEHSFVPLLNALPETDGVAPVLVLRDGKPVGSLIPATFDSLEYMHHMHGLSVVSRDGKLFAIALSWPNGGENAAGKRNDGRIAIFEAVPVDSQ